LEKSSFLGKNRRFCKEIRKLSQFFEDFCENVWWVLKNVVPLHSLSLKNELRAKLKERVL